MHLATCCAAPRGARSVTAKARRSRYRAGVDCRRRCGGGRVTKVVAVACARFGLPAGKKLRPTNRHEGGSDETVGLVACATRYHSEWFRLAELARGYASIWAVIDVAPLTRSSFFGAAGRHVRCCASAHPVALTLQPPCILACTLSMLGMLGCSHVARNCLRCACPVRLRC